MNKSYSIFENSLLSIIFELNKKRLRKMHNIFDE